jgi:hypothetical protein
MNSYPSTRHGIDLRNYGPPRTSGIHFSSIVRHVALKTGELAKEYANAPSLTDLINNTDLITANHTGPIVRSAVGFMWETWLATRIHNANPNFTHQPGELVCDGVIATPDGIEETTALDITWHPHTNYVIHEFKATWKSSGYPVTDQLMWLWQCMGHCYMLGKELDQPVLTAVIHPLYLAGDYRSQRDPVYKPTVIEFDQEELEMNWKMLMQYKDCVMPEVW